MRFRIAGVRLELGQRPSFDPVRGKAQRHQRVIPRIKVDTPGFRTPGSRLDSTRGPPATGGVQYQGFDFAVFQADSGGGGFLVASQKSGPVDSDVPRFARQHTFSAGKEPENKDLAAQTVIWLRLDPGSHSGVHHGIHPETVCAGDLRTRLSRAYSIQTRPGRDCLAFRCLAEKCLTRSQGLDSPALDPCCRSPIFPV